MSSGLVTTIIPVYNRAPMLREAVASVLAQTYRPIEIIIVDDGSTDETAGVADSLASEHSEIGVIHRENGGPGLAREAGRRAVSGELIQYLDSDDLLLPRKFSLQVAGLRSDPEAGASYGWTLFRHADGRIEESPWKETGVKRRSMFPAFLRARWWDTPTPLYRASVCAAAGPWSDLRLEEDWEYDARIAALGTKLHFVPEYVAEVRDHDQGRLCRGEALEPARMRERARAHLMILEHARRAGIGDDADEMRHFARELFLLARQTGAAGLAAESQRLFEASRSASGPDAGRLQFRIYGVLASAFGWDRLGRIACLSDRLRPTRR